MPISVQCPECGKRLSAPDTAAGRKARCPDCGAAVPIPEPVYDAEEVFETSEAEEIEAADEDDDYGEPSGRPPGRLPARRSGSRRPCPACGEMIVATAVKCRYCGEVLDESAARGMGSSRVVEREAQRLIREKQDKETALQLFVTGLIGCFSPILVIYGVVFLARRSYDFPRK
ncbi:MAG TPA: hypothetical protein VML55_14130, partial [Planctomycetaceae bacterium]|nr:hypothetical protein [Planctomycetaceae bacterium]